MEFKDVSADEYIDIIKNRLPKVLQLLEPSDQFIALAERFKDSEVNFDTAACTVISMSISKDGKDSYCKSEFIEVKFVVNHHPNDVYVWYFKRDCE